MYRVQLVVEFRAFGSPTAFSESKVYRIGFCVEQLFATLSFEPIFILNFHPIFVFLYFKKHDTSNAFVFHNLLKSILFPTKGTELNQLSWFFFQTKSNIYF